MDKEKIIITPLDKGFIVQIGDKQLAKEKSKDALILVESNLYD